MAIGYIINDCGCKITTVIIPAAELKSLQPTSVSLKIVYCPRHAAADEMYGRLHDALGHLTKGTHSGVRAAIAEIEAGIAKADGDEDGG